MDSSFDIARQWVNFHITHLWDRLEVLFPLAFTNHCLTCFSMRELFSKQATISSLMRLAYLLIQEINRLRWTAVTYFWSQSAAHAQLQNRQEDPAVSELKSVISWPAQFPIYFALFVFLALWPEGVLWKTSHHAVTLIKAWLGFSEVEITEGSIAFYCILEPWLTPTILFSAPAAHGSPNILCTSWCTLD